MDLLRLADEYQTSANEHTGLAGYAAQNAADKIRMAHMAAQQADSHIAAVANGDGDPLVAA